MLRGMLRPASALPIVMLAAALLAPRIASAQPVSFQLRNDVPVGQKPQLLLRAEVKVTDIRLDLTRDDGQTFTVKHGPLGRGQRLALPVGDGKPGTAKWTGRISVLIVGGDPWGYDLSFDTAVRAPMSIKFDIDHLDLDGKVLKFQQSRPAGKAAVKVIGEDGDEIGAGEATFAKEPAGTWLPVPWTQSKPGRVLMLRLHVEDPDGITVDAELVPWSVAIEHEDVNFDTDSAVVRPAEAGKLDASLERIREVAKKAERFLKVKLYVAGHTDTVGSAQHNRQLSLDRARAIAEYFRKKGLALPIVYEGFGEDVPKVGTADNVDEPRNRRADYVLGAADGQPPFTYRAAATSWKPVR
jgi:outer membrane protein OmpA-like peptidoglycan-associated protein